MLENKLKEFEIIWRKHALHKMLEWEISREHVIETINKGKVIQEYFDDKPFSSVLILIFLVFNDTSAFSVFS